MCWKSELTRCRIALNIVAVIVILGLVAGIAVIVLKAEEWFPTYRGYDGVYKRITSSDSRSMNLTAETAGDCENANTARLMIGRVVYKCGDRTKGECILMDQRCDGYDDCGDNSDERNCGVNEEFCTEAVSAGVRFVCDVFDKTNQSAVQRCFLTDYKCDGQLDCTAAGLKVTDESDCQETFTVGKDGLVCGIKNDWVCKDSYVCVREEDICNGFENCFDGSDEENCLPVEPS